LFYVSVLYIAEYYREWEGAGDPGETPVVDKMVLSPGQLIMLYFLMFMAFASSLIVLCFEKGLKWFKDHSGVDVYGMGTAVSEFYSYTINN
jgi:hypothetical protein